jgi:hypothetical protein
MREQAQKASIERANLFKKKKKLTLAQHDCDNFRTIATKVRNAEVYTIEQELERLIKKIQHQYAAQM